MAKLPLSAVTADRVASLRARMAAEKVSDGEGGKVQRWKPNTVNRTLALLRKVLNDGVAWGFARSAPKVKLLPVAEIGFDYLQRAEAERFLSTRQRGSARRCPALHRRDLHRPADGRAVGPALGGRRSRARADHGAALVRPGPHQVQEDPPRPDQQGAVAGVEGVARPLPEGRSRARLPDAGRQRARAGATASGLRQGAGGGALPQDPISRSAAHGRVADGDVGLSLRAVQGMLGHSTIAVTERYAHLAPDFQEREADRLSLNVQQGLGSLVALDGGR